ncbi:activator of HSP90 ATPase [Asanoa ishikariensis]|uniref:Activator of Hsp90 ATPase homolog 1-like protein n=1 Tax=Asanoa ishikariensis TaxID=137265 RepID=A0A1H3T360_9ACTN|nr:SRPBCC domain-containing protein [Asanoa ishikariensis]GIF63167.1 activator of HSP90 ATPase [Asanoa ishikariensis]SDZ43799.1 Activator of Hsp90 ATPase homolog 1-like protein [Asanoa ishikariensis]
MVDILHRVGAIAPLDDFYRAVATPEGLAGWWTTDTVGKSEVGEKLAFRFGDLGGFDMEILELDPAGHVRWRVVEGPPEWIGTEIDWRFEQRDDYTIVLFKHEGWKEPVEFMHHCSTKWGSYLLSLRELVETGRGRPAPHDVKVADFD